MKKSRKPIYSVGGIIMLVGASLVVITKILLEDALIISLGIRMVRALQRGAVATVLVGGIVSAVAAALSIKDVLSVRRERNRQEIERQRLVEIEAANLPNVIRQRFMRLKQRKSFSDLVLVVFSQLDQIDVLQARQSELLQINDAAYLQKTVAVVDEIERKICKNCQYIHNLCLVASDWEHSDQDKIVKLLNDNKRKLQDVRELLELSADLINKRDIDESKDLSELESWIETIQDSLKEE